MLTHNTLIWVLLYLVSDSPRNHVTCRTDQPGVELYVRDSGASSQECELKQSESSSHINSVLESRSDLSQGPKKLIILDINVHLPSDLFDLYHVGDIYSYNAKNGNIFGSIKEGETLIWDPGPSDCVTNVKVTGNDKVSIILENGHIKVFKRLEQLWYEAVDDIDAFEDEFRRIPSNFGIDFDGSKAWKSKQENYRNLPALNGSDVDVLAENKDFHDPAYTNIDLTDPFNLEISTVGSGLSNDPTKYYFIKVDSDEGHFIFKSGVKCDQILVNGVLIWKNSCVDPFGMYPKSVSYYNSDRLSINFIDDLITFEKQGSVWNQKTRPKICESNEVRSEPSIWQAGLEAHSKPVNLGTHTADSSSQPSSDCIINRNNNNNYKQLENSNYNNSSGSPPPNPGPRRNSSSTVASDSSTTKLTSIHLDVKNTDSTDTFTCIKKDGFAKYTAKVGHGFASVKKGGSTFSRAVDEIWSASEPRNYATAVVRDGTGATSSMSNVTVFWFNKWKHFTKSDNEYMVDSDIRLFGADSSDASKTKQITSSQYTRTFVDDVFSFVINDVTKCTEVKYMYRSLEAGDSSKVAVNLDLVWKHDSNVHGNQYPKLVKFYWPDKMMISFEHIFIIHRKNAEGKWDNGQLFDFKLYTKVNDKLWELDATAYEFMETNDEVFVIFKKDSDLAEVRHKGVSVWKHDPVQGDKFPNLLSYIKDGSMVYIDFQTSFVLCKKSGDNTWSSNEFFIKFYSVDPNDDTEFIELTASSFTVDEYQQGADFKMKDGAKCMLIKSDSKILWKHGPATDTGFFPTSIRYFRSKVIVNLDVSVILCEKDSTNNWKKIDIPIKLYKRDPKDFTKFLDLSGNEYNLVHQGENHKFVINKNVMISMIKTDGKELWFHDGYIIQGPHPTSVIYAKNKKKITVDYENYFMIYKQEDDGVWDKGQIIDMKLFARDSRDAEKTFVLNDNHYVLKDNVDEFEFDLKPHIKCVTVKLTGDEVWKYDPVLNSGKFPKRILYKRHKTIVSLVFEGFYVVIEKHKGSEIWVARESIPLDIAKSTPTHQYTYEVHELFLIYTPKDDYLFSLVKLGENVIYDPSSPCDLASKVLVYKTSDLINIVDLHLSGGIIKRYSKRFDDTWYEKLTTLTLDLKMEANGSFFKCYGRGMGSYYTKKSFGFGDVVFGSSPVWKANNDTDYAYKVDVNELEEFFDVHVHLKGGAIEKYRVNKLQRPKLLDVPEQSCSGSAASSQPVSLV